MKILICNEWLFGGGAETVMYTLVEQLLKDGHDITILASPKSDDEAILQFTEMFIIDV